MSTPEEIKADIELQRDQLADTVDQLSHKLDVKAQGKARVESLRARLTNEAGKPRPEVLGAGAAVVVALVLVVWWRGRS